jgi:outer membrane protein W
MQKVLLFFIALLFLGVYSLSSQTKFNINIYGGYTLPVADLAGDFPDTAGSSGTLDFKKSSTLLTSWGYNFGALVKYSIDTIGNARVTAGLNNNSFTGTKDYVTPSGRNINYKNKVNVFTLSAGFEYSLSPAKKLNPFVGLDFGANFYSGKIEASGDTTILINRKSEARFGVIANGGVDINLNKSVGIVIGVKYALTNLIGKKTELTSTITPVTDAIEEEGSSSFDELPLNDAETSSNKSKSLNYVQFYAGISIYLGKKVGK